MDTDTTTRAALVSDAILGRMATLTYVAQEVHIAGMRSDWYAYFMGHLANIGFNGSIDWCYEWTDGQTCVALQELSHADNAIAVVTSIALDETFMHGNDGWSYTWYTRYGTWCGRTMLQGAYLMDATFPTDGIQKQGWRFVMPMLNTNSIRNVRHTLPTTATAWNMGRAHSEQVF